MTIQQEIGTEMLPTEEGSHCVSQAQIVCAPDAPRSLAQQRLHFERDRLRTIESTFTELMQELVAELAASEARLHQLENDLGVRDEEVDALRSELQLRDVVARSHSENYSASRRESFVPPDEVDRKLADAELALFESQEEQQELRGQLARAHKQLNLRAEELNELRAQLVELSMTTGDAQASNAAVTHELLDLRAERKLLIQRLAEAEGHLQQFSQIDLSEIDNLRRRFEMAVQDVRDLKIKNSQLEGELAKIKSGKVSAKGTGGADVSDWESRKKTLLAQLESETNDADPRQRQDRLTVESTIRITDDVVAQKEREIRELRALLDESSGGISQSQSLSNAVVDKDEFIQQARERMRMMEAEWSEKQRRAEVEISLERAKLARERSLLDERGRVLDKERAQLQATNVEARDNTPTATKVSKGGNWLARLGLKDERK